MVCSGEREEEEDNSRYALMNRYSSAIPRGGSVSRTLARQTKSKARQMRGSSAYPQLRSSVDRYVPNSASDAYEQLISSVSNQRRAKSCAYNVKADAFSAAEASLMERKRQRNNRQLRAQSGMIKKLIKKVSLFLSLVLL